MVERSEQGENGRELQVGVKSSKILYKLGLRLYREMSDCRRKCALQGA